MIGRLPTSTRTDTLFPSRTRFRSAVGAFGDEDDAAVLAARRERRLDAQNAAQFAMRARLGRHGDAVHPGERDQPRSEEHTSELHSLMRISYAVFCLKKKLN